MSDQNQNIDTIKGAQADMYRAYANGSVGVISSGLVWLTAAIVSYALSAKHGIYTLLIGGVFIFPLSIIISKIIGLNGTHSKENPLGNLAMEGTILMLFCLPIAFGLSALRPEFFFQGMLLIIGGRYLTFVTIYGRKIYWILGGILGIAAFLLFSLRAQSFVSALTGSTIEIAFGLYMLIAFRKSTVNN